VHGFALVFSAANIDGPATRMIALRVTDTGGATAIAASILNIINASRRPGFRGGGGDCRRRRPHVSFAGRGDPSAADVLAGFKYSYDFNDDGVFDVTDSASPSATVPPALYSRQALT